VEGPNIPHRWLAEKTAIFAIELAEAFVSDLKACTRRVQTTWCSLFLVRGNRELGLTSHHGTFRERRS